MAHITIGGKQTELPHLNLKTMRRVLPLVQEMQSGGASNLSLGDADKLIGLSLKTLATWLVGVPKGPESETAVERDARLAALVDAKAEELDEEMMGAEFVALTPALMESMREQGFFPKEAAPPGGTPPSP